MLRIGTPAETKSPEAAVALDHDARERSADLREFELVLGRVQPDLGILDHFLLHADHQLDLADLVVAGFRKVKGLAGLGDKRPGDFQVPVGDFDPGPGGLGLGQPCVGQPHLGLGRVIGSRHFLGFSRRRRVLRGEFREAVVLLLGEREVRLGNLDGCLRLLDGFVDFVGGEFQGIFRPCLLGPCPGKGLPGNVDLKGNFFLELGQACFLPFQLRLGKFELAARLLHLVSVVDRFDLRQHLALLDLVILFDKETDDAARNHLRSDVDDVRLDESIVGDGMGETVGEPVNAEVRHHDRDRSGGTPDGPPDVARQMAVRAPATGGETVGVVGGGGDVGGALDVSDVMVHLSIGASARRQAASIPPYSMAVRELPGVGVTPIAYSRRTRAMR